MRYSANLVPFGKSGRCVECREKPHGPGGIMIESFQSSSFKAQSGQCIPNQDMQYNSSKTWYQDILLLCTGCWERNTRHSIRSV